MDELSTRLIATGVVERLIARGYQPLPDGATALKREPATIMQVRVWPNGSGATIRVGFTTGLAVEAIIPPGFFDYDRIADALCHQIQNATMESD